MKLKALALGSGILIVLAVAAFAVNRWMYAPPSAGRIGQPLLPDLDLSETSQIRIESNEHEVTLNSEDGTNWTVAEQHGFPVDTKKLKGLLFKLANERVAHQVTENPDKLAALGLLMPEENGNKREKDKTGVLVSLLDKQGQPMFRLLIGNDRSQGAAFGGTYVRFPEHSAAYLVSDSILADFRPEDWIDTVVFDVEADKVLKSIRISKSGKRPLRLGRDKPGDPWRVDGIDPERLNQQEAKNLANQLAGLDIFNIMPGDSDPAKVGRKKTGRLEFEFFDKRKFSVEIGEEAAPDDYRYLTLRAELDPSVQDEDLRRQVEAFNRRYDGRLLAVYDWDGGRMLRERKDFLAKKKP